MRGRWLQPEFFTGKRFAKLTPTDALVYLALRNLADDGGVVECDPELVKGQVFFRWTSIGIDDVRESLRHLSGTGDAPLLTLYTVDDQEFAKIHDWDPSLIHKPSKFRHPRPSRKPEVVTLEPVTANGDGPHPHQSGNGAAPVPNSPHRLLDSQTPKTPKGKADDVSSPFPKVDCDRLFDFWVDAVGAVNYGLFRKTLAPLFPVKGAKYTIGQLEDAIKAFSEVRRSASPKEAGFMTVIRFAEDVVRWVDLGAMSLSDVSGLTERGKLI